MDLITIGLELQLDANMVWLRIGIGHGFVTIGLELELDMDFIIILV
jgi:hypothetical protein